MKNPDVYDANHAASKLAEDVGAHAN